VLLLSLITALSLLLPQPAAARAETEGARREDISAMLNAAPYREVAVIAGFRGVSADELAGLFPGEEISVTTLFEAGEGAELLAEVTSPRLTTEELLRKLAEIPSVLYAEPDYLAKPAEDGGQPQNNGTSGTALTPYEFVPNLASRQWGLSDASPVRDDSMNGKEPGSSVHAFPDLSGTGSNMDRTVYCAVIDEFVDHNNPDLTDVIVHFTDEEQRALGCGEWGYNATTYGGAGQSPAYFIPGFHGTHCAGLLGASWDGKGISGAASNVWIVSVQVDDPGDKQREKQERRQKRDEFQKSEHPEKSSSVADGGYSDCGVRELCLGRRIIRDCAGFYAAVPV